MKTMFEDFVNECVSNWRIKEKILESGGIIKVAARRRGDIAENFVFNKIKKLTPEYIPVKSKGSQTPADIYSISKRQGFWHIMLIQVKSSVNKAKIYSMNEQDIKELNELAKVVKEVITNSKITSKYKNDPFIISTGYAKVWRNELNNTVIHSLVNAERLTKFKMNAIGIDSRDLEKKIDFTHNLQS